MRKWATVLLAAALTLTGLSLFAQAKIAVVDTMKVANESKEGKKIQASLKAYHDQKQAECRARPPISQHRLECHAFRRCVGIQTGEGYLARVADLLTYG